MINLIKKKKKKKNEKNFFFFNSEGKKGEKDLMLFLKKVTQKKGLNTFLTENPEKHNYCARLFLRKKKK
jgi:hypothetical protein